MDVKQRILDFIKYKGISIKRFEEMCQLSNGYISSMRKGFGSDKLNNVLNSFPDLNRDWLLYGEGEMLKPSISQTSNGDNNTQVSGNKNQVNSSSTLDRALDEISEQRKLVSKSQEQIDRLLAIIENFQTK